MSLFTDKETEAQIEWLPEVTAFTQWRSQDKSRSPRHLSLFNISELMEVGLGGEIKNCTLELSSIPYCEIILFGDRISH